MRKTVTALCLGLSLFHFHHSRQEKVRKIMRVEAKAMGMSKCQERKLERDLLPLIDTLLEEGDRRADPLVHLEDV